MTSWKLKVGDYAFLRGGEKVRIEKVLGHEIYEVTTEKVHLIYGRPLNTFKAKIIQELILIGEIET